MNSNKPDCTIDVGKTAEIADILHNERRIQTLIAFESADEEGLTVSDLAERIAECEHGSEFDADDRKRVYVALYQTHIPTLESADVVAVDRGVVTPGKRFKMVVSALRRIQG